MRKIFLLLMAGCISGSLFAGGYKIGLQGQKQIGMAHIGIGTNLDAAVAYFNPGAMSFVDNQLQIGANLLAPRTQFLETATQIKTDANAAFFVPFEIYGNYHLKNTPFNIGLGIYTPFGSGINYPLEWPGRFVLTGIKMQTVFIQPTASVQIGKTASFGAGFIMALGNVSLNKRLPMTQATGVEYSEGTATLSGSAHGVGFNTGLYFQPTKKLSAGLSYRSRVNMKIKNGKAEFGNIPGALQNNFPQQGGALTTRFSSTLPMPAEMGLGIGYRPGKKVLLAGELNYHFWEAYKTLSFDYAENTALLEDTESPRNYKNTWSIRLGINVDVNNRFAFRAGTFFDETPVRSGYVSPELPDANKFGFTSGITVWLENRLSLDASLLYEDVAIRTDKNLETNLEGTYKTKVVAPGIGLNFLLDKQNKNKFKKAL